MSPNLTTEEVSKKVADRLLSHMRLNYTDSPIHKRVIVPTISVLFEFDFPQWPHTLHDQ